MKKSQPAFTLGDEQKFEALKMRYKDQVELLRYMTTLDFRIFGGYITLQLLLGSWLSQHSPAAFSARIGVAAIDLALTIVATALLHNEFKLRTEVVATLKNIAVALRFSEEDVYITPGTLNAPTKFRAWRHWYLLGIVVAFCGIVFLLFSDAFAAPTAPPMSATPMSPTPMSATPPASSP